VLEHCEKIKDRIGVALVHGGLGTLYQRQEQWNEALDHLKQSADLCKAGGAYVFLPQTYEALAQVYLGLGQIQDALTAAQSALEWAEGNQDRRWEAIVCLKLGKIYLVSADLDKAEDHAQKSLNLAQEDPPLPDQAQAATELLREIDQVRKPARAAVQRVQVAVLLSDSPKVNPVKLRRLLNKHFNINELRDLCFDLRVDFEDLPGETRGDKVRELVAYLERRGRLLDLVEIGKQLRPDVPWGDALVGDDEAS
jgi:tetratricopeptide (TPR) repeat protein